MKVHERHPYAGKLVFTAFSGSHQDAINKGMHAMRERKSKIWQVPYLPIDPSDIGRSYEPIVRINSQSGKGGVAFIMETYFGYKLPKGMHKEFADIIQIISEKQGEVAPDQIMDEFKKSYIDMKEPLHFKRCKFEDIAIMRTDVLMLPFITLIMVWRNSLMQQVMDLLMQFLKACKMNLILILRYLTIESMLLVVVQELKQQHIFICWI